MTDCIDIFNAMKDLRKKKRELFGVPCPVCVEKLPRANPSILIPQQTCRIHGYKDQRPHSTMDSLYEQPKDPT